MRWLPHITTIVNGKVKKLPPQTLSTYQNKQLSDYLSSRHTIVKTNCSRNQLIPFHRYH